MISYKNLKWNLQICPILCTPSVCHTRGFRKCESGNSSSRERATDSFCLHAGSNIGVPQRARFDGSGIFFRLDFILFSRACVLIRRTEKEGLCSTSILALATR